MVFLGNKKALLISLFIINSLNSFGEEVKPAPCLKPDPLAKERDQLKKDFKDKNINLSKAYLSSLQLRIDQGVDTLNEFKTKDFVLGDAKEILNNLFKEQNHLDEVIEEIERLSKIEKPSDKEKANLKLLKESLKKHGEDALALLKERLKALKEGQKIQDAHKNELNLLLHKVIDFYQLGEVWKEKDGKKPEELKLADRKAKIEDLSKEIGIEIGVERVKPPTTGGNEGDDNGKDDEGKTDEGKDDEGKNDNGDKDNDGDNDNDGDDDDGGGGEYIPPADHSNPVKPKFKSAPKTKIIIKKGVY